MIRKVKLETPHERCSLQECEKVVTNIARVLKLCKAEVPYYIGCNRPMLGQSLPATFCKLLSLHPHLSNSLVQFV